VHGLGFESLTFGGKWWCRSMVLGSNLGDIGLVTPSSTREEETKLLMFITWMGYFACHWHRHQVQGTSDLRLIRRTRAIEVKQLAQGCKQILGSMVV
jgi:hypothetical protein